MSDVSREVYRNPWMTVREDDVVHPDGSAGVFGVVVKPDFALVIPWDGERLVLIEEYRHPVGERVWAFPQGSYEQDPTVPPERVAAGELREETGLAAAGWEHLGRLLVAPGYSSQGAQVYLATGLSGALDPQEAGLRAARVTPEELEAWVADGLLRDSASLAAHLLLQARHPQLLRRRSAAPPR